MNEVNDILTVEEKAYIRGLVNSSKNQVKLIQFCKCTRPDQPNSIQGKAIFIYAYFTTTIKLHICIKFAFEGVENKKQYEVHELNLYS